MSGSFNSQKLARDVANGVVYLNPSKLKKYKPEELATIVRQLNIVLRKIRASQTPPEQMKKKNRQLQAINQAVTIINGYAKKHRIRI
jgi:hypothetical protein